MLNHISSALRAGSRWRRRSSSVDVQVTEEDDHQQVDESQGEVQTLGNNARVVVNHTYSIAYEPERLFYRNSRDVDVMHQEYFQLMNDRILEVCNVPTKRCVELPREPAHVDSPSMKIEPYFSGTTGIPSSKVYVPDPKYRKHVVRELSGEDISLHQLHQNIGPDGTRKCLHVALVGTQGCGKSVLCRRYATMVLRKEVPELADVKLVHYMSPKHLPLRNDPTRYSINRIIFQRLISTDETCATHGYDWICKNPEKILFIFDGVDERLLEFSENIQPINYNSRTTFSILLQNILIGRVFRGCRTLISARDRSFINVCGNCRPQKFVMVGSLNVEQRVALIQSICMPEPLVAEEICSKLLRKFPAGFSFTKDALFINLAIASFRWGSEDDNPRMNSDVILVVMILQHMLRSNNSSRQILDHVGPYRAVAFEMIRDGVMSRRHREMLKHRDVKFESTVDMMVVAPQHKRHIYYRPLSNDFSYFFSSQVYQEALAAFHISEMSLSEFTVFVDEQLHTRRWHVVRRFVCGYLLHEDVKKSLTYFRAKISHSAQMEEKLLSSLAEQLKIMDSLSSYDRFELLASLYESGKAAQPIIETGVRSLVLPDITLESCDLHAISRIECYVRHLDKVDICLDRDVNIEEFDGIASFIVSKGEDARLDLSKLHLTSGHVSGLERPMKNGVAGETCQAMKIVANRQTSSDVLGLFENISRAGLCSISIEEV